MPSNAGKEKDIVCEGQSKEGGVDLKMEMSVEESVKVSMASSSPSKV
jgi:hypothetical protein